MTITTAQFVDILNDTYEHAVAARAFATTLEAEDPKVAHVWHALADRLHEAAEQAANMDKIIIPIKP